MFPKGGKMKKIIVASLAVMAICFNVQAKYKDPGMVDGKKLEKKFWSEMQKKNWQAVDTMMAPGFQSVHMDGSRDKAGEIALIKNLQLDHYKLSNFKVTKNGDTQVVSYTAAAPEKIDNKKLSKMMTPRLSVWKMTSDGWQMVSHSNLNK